MFIINYKQQIWLIISIIKEIKVVDNYNNGVEDIAKWSNALNELAESTRLGIPVVLTSNPKNHSNMILAEYKNDKYTIFPSTLGIASAALGEEKSKGSYNIIKDFSNIVKQEFMASGIRKGYMYSADIMTDAKWARNNETFSWKWSKKKYYCILEKIT